MLSPLIDRISTPGGQMRCKETGRCQESLLPHVEVRIKAILLDCRLKLATDCLCYSSISSSSLLAGHCVLLKERCAASLRIIRLPKD